jgi:uncharacterized protein YfiM (DUF2279 family)
MSNLTMTKGSRQVAFGPVQIYHFEVALGNSPSVSSGPPICLGGFLKQSVATVNRLALEKECEELLGEDRNKLKAGRREMKLSSDVRVMMLLAAGVSRKEIEEATIAAWEARAEHMEAVQRRRSKKERSDNFRRFFTQLFHRQDEALAEAKQATSGTNREDVSKIVKPTVRAAAAC